MLKIPLNDIVAKIKQETGSSDQEINSKIDEKLKQLSGLISREGAAHIIANELGVKIFEESSGKLQIGNILAGMRSVEAVGRVTNKFELREFQTENRSGKLASFVIGDETGTIRVVMWGSMAENIKTFNEDDIIKISGGYVRENQGRKEVHMNERSKVIVNPEGETVGEVKRFPSAERKSISELDENSQNVELLGTVVQAFEPRFFEVCPKCGKRAKPEGGSFMCPVHSAVDPSYSYVMNVFLDDGTENMRCVLFKNQAERLLGKKPEEMLLYKEDPSSFESIKNDLLGNMVKMVGRVKKNDMFDRLEFNTQLVFTDIDPKEEAAKLSSDNAAVSSEDPVKAEEESINSEVEKINR